MKRVALSLTAAALIGTALQADELSDLKAQIAELQEKTDALIDETSDLKTGFNYTTVETDASVNGMGPAASKVYYSKSPLSIGGYGEMYWASSDKEGTELDPSAGDAHADIYRFVPYIGYKFSDNIILNTELEFEHGGEEVAVEFMYLDFLLGEAFNLQVGHLLVPMGLVNQRHEPTLFNTVQRPDVERYLIPSTWHENGILAYGNLGDTGLSYSAGIINALNVANDNNQPGSVNKKWIRSGRVGGEEDGPMQRVAFVGRLDYSGVPGLLLGGSTYYGAATQGRPSGVDAFIYDLHGQYEVAGFKFKGVYTATSVSNADKIFAEAADGAEGYYVNAEYNLLATAATRMKLPVFVQYENYDPVSSVAGGTRPDLEQSNTAVGVNFFPIDQVVLKADYVMTDYRNNADAAEEDFNTFSLGLGFIF
jgi:hypothetical protein